MKPADHYEDKSRAALKSAESAPIQDAMFSVACAQVYATLAQASAIEESSGR